MVEEKSPHIKVLIVDDDKSIAEVLEGLISNDEKTVHVCHDGIVALERIDKNPYDLILSDLMMPKISGLDILKYEKK